MNIKKHIPNFLTCCNLLCGCLGIIKCFEPIGFYFGGYNYQNLVAASLLIFLACIFDFLDGFAARVLKVPSTIGKELDSLADVVSFGVLPGLILYQLIMMTDFVQSLSTELHTFIYYFETPPGIIVLLIPIFSALRLAKFNIDTRQSESFIGVPTPANAILIASLPLILAYSDSSLIKNSISNPYFLITLTLLMSYLLVAEFPLFALKFKNFKWADNKIRFIFMGASIILFIFLIWTAIPIIIFLYIILSLVENKIIKPNSPKL
jgi:CDP-diacylglycerol---serine O-phosphatidyltransferase